MNIELIQVIISTILFIIATILTVMWFGWNLVLIIFLFLWANNMAQELNK